MSDINDNSENENEETPEEFAEKVDAFLDRHEIDEDEQQDARESATSIQKQTENEENAQAVKNLREILNNLQHYDPQKHSEFYKLNYIATNIKFFKRFFDIARQNEDGGTYNEKTTTINISFNIKRFINSFTNFKFDPFGGIRANMLHGMQDRLKVLYDLGQIFGRDFIGNIDIHFKMDNIDEKLAKFIGEHETPFKAYEHHVLKCIMLKLIISLFSDVEYAFCQKNTTLTRAFSANIQEINRIMSYAAKSSDDFAKCWQMFFNKLTDETTMYKFTTMEEATARIVDCVMNRFPVEIFLADVLKTYIPSIAFNYLNVVKCSFLLVRLLSIYLEQSQKAEELAAMTGAPIETRDLERIAILAHAVAVDYESSYFSSAMIPRTMPKSEGCSEEFKLYYISHTLTGPQYYILKQLELSLPVLFVF